MRHSENAYYKEKEKKEEEEKVTFKKEKIWLKRRLFQTRKQKRR